VRVPGRHFRVCATLVSAVLLNGCGGGGSDSSGGSTTAQPAATPSRPIEQTNLQIASALYDGSVRVPADFSVDSVPSGHAAVATTHVKNTDVDLALDGAAAQFELCTDDWNQALGWSETSALNSSQYSNLVATNDDERYFEFGRMKSGSPQVYVQSRIYKCTYLDRAGANLRAAAGAAGQLNARPLTSMQLRRLSEYVWQFTTYNNYGHVVLKSAGSAVEHTLHIANLIRGGVSATCDRIDVIAWSHRVDSATGALSLDVRPLFSFGARESAGVAQLCD